MFTEPQTPTLTYRIVRRCQESGKVNIILCLLKFFENIIRFVILLSIFICNFELFTKNFQLALNMPTNMSGCMRFDFDVHQHDA